MCHYTALPLHLAILPFLAGTNHDLCLYPEGPQGPLHLGLGVPPTMDFTEIVAQYHRAVLSTQSS